MKPWLFNDGRFGRCTATTDARTPTSSRRAHAADDTATNTQVRARSTMPLATEPSILRRTIMPSDVHAITRLDLAGE